MTPLSRIITTTVATITLASYLLTTLPLVSSRHTGLQAGTGHHSNLVSSINRRNDEDASTLKRKRIKKKKTCPAPGSRSTTYHPSGAAAAPGSTDDTLKPKRIKKKKKTCPAPGSRSTTYHPSVPAAAAGAPGSTDHTSQPATSGSEPTKYKPQDAASGSELTTYKSPDTTASSDFATGTQPASFNPINKQDTSATAQTGSDKCDGSFGGQKMGLGWNDGDKANMEMFIKTGKVGWYYTWSPWSTDEGNCIEFVLMFWGQKQQAMFHEKFDPNKHKWILGFNEPDQPDQSFMDATWAAQYWIENVASNESMAGAKKVSPAPTGGGDGSYPENDRGKIWLKTFFAACNGRCDISAIAVHWYGKNPEAFKKYVESMYQQFKLPVWVTEFACHDFTVPEVDQKCTRTEVETFVKVAIPWLQEQEWVHRFAYFGSLKNMNNVGTENRLMNEAGNEITDLGRVVLAL